MGDATRPFLYVLSISIFSFAQDGTSDGLVGSFDVSISFQLALLKGAYEMNIIIMIIDTEKLFN